LFALPTPAEISTIAEQFGVHLGDEDARLYQRFLVEQLEMLDGFVQSRVE